MATITEVAKRAGVVPSIVSRLLNDDPALRIRPETRQRITSVIEELGYTPNHAGRALKLARTSAIALVVPDVTNPIYAGILRGAESRARDAGYIVLLGNADDLSQREGLYKRLVSEGRIDGVLLQRTNDTEDETLIRLAHTRVPTVLINSEVDGVRGSVIFDDESGARVAVKHLVSLGHEHIGHLSGPAATDTAARRRKGFEAALAAAGLECREDWIVQAGYDEGGGFEAMQRLLSRSVRPTAVFVANLLAAVGALKATREAGIKVPDHMSLIALHDAWYAEHTCPPLTTVKLPLHELGHEAVTLLLDCISGADPRHVVVRNPVPSVIDRSSTAPFANG